MGIKIVSHPPYSPDLAPCDFCLFPKVIDSLTQEDVHEAFQKLFEQYNKCIAAGRDYFEGD